MTAADPLEVLARFYRIVVADQPEMTFERFVPWATVVLGDFASVDHELGDVDMVFQNLADIQGIEDWSFGEDPWSEDQKAFERQWRKLPALYRQLHAALLGDGLATRAQLTRRVAEGEQQLDVDHVLAAGLATMSQAEWKCLNRWHAQHSLTLLWDADASYVDDVHNEAGLFVRKYRGSTPRSPERPWRRTHRGSRWSPVLRPQAKPSTSATCSQGWPLKSSTARCWSCRMAAVWARCCRRCPCNPKAST